jgi:hypothetical protein
MMSYDQMCLDERFSQEARQRLIEFKRNRWAAPYRCDCPLPDNWPGELVENYSHDVYFNMAHGVPHEPDNKECPCHSCVASVGIEGGRKKQVNAELVRMVLKERLAGEQEFDRVPSGSEK